MTKVMLGAINEIPGMGEGGLRAVSNEVHVTSGVVEWRLRDRDLDAGDSSLHGVHQGIHISSHLLSWAGHGQFFGFQEHQGERRAKKLYSSLAANLRPLLGHILV